MIDVENMLTASSIPAATGRYFAPYFNDPDDLLFHRGIVGAFIKIIQMQSSKGGNEPVLRQGQDILANVVRISLEALDLSPGGYAEDVARWRLQTDLSDSSRKVLHKIFTTYGKQASVQDNLHGEFNEIMLMAKAEIKGITHKYLKPLKVKGNAGRSFSFHLAGSHLGYGIMDGLSAPVRAVIDSLQNLPVSSKQAGSFAHYFISFD
jgi:hypothetical protein